MTDSDFGPEFDRRVLLSTLNDKSLGFTTTSLRPNGHSIRFSPGHTMHIYESVLQNILKVQEKNKPLVVSLDMLLDNKDFISSPGNIALFMKEVLSEVSQSGPDPIVKLVSSQQLEAVQVEEPMDNINAGIAYNKWIDSAQSRLETRELRKEISEMIIDMYNSQSANAEGIKWFMNHDKVKDAIGLLEKSQGPDGNVANVRKKVDHLLAPLPNTKGARMSGIMRFMHALKYPRLR